MSGAACLAVDSNMLALALAAVHMDHSLACNLEPVHFA